MGRERDGDSLLLYFSNGVSASGEAPLPALHLIGRLQLRLLHQRRTGPGQDEARPRFRPAAKGEQWWPGVPLPLRSRRPRARRDSRRRCVALRHQEAPRDGPEHRKDREELPTGPIIMLSF